MMDDGFTDDIWCLYFHDPLNTDWTHSSYVKLGQASSASEFNGMYKEMKDLIPFGMFFLSREHVFPAWDDPENRKGGCVCIKIPKQDAPSFWEGTCASLMGETILNEDFRDDETVVNCVSISPKSFFCIVKLWLNNKKLSEADASAYNLPPFDNNLMFKANDQESLKFINQRS